MTTPTVPSKFAGLEAGDYLKVLSGVNAIRIVTDHRIQAWLRTARTTPAPAVHAPFQLTQGELDVAVAYMQQAVNAVQLIIDLRGQLREAKQKLSSTPQGSADLGPCVGTLRRRVEELGAQLLSACEQRDRATAEREQLLARANTAEARLVAAGVGDLELLKMAVREQTRRADCLAAELGACVARAEKAEKESAHATAALASLASAMRSARQTLHATVADALHEQRIAMPLQFPQQQGGAT